MMKRSWRWTAHTATELCIWKRQIFRYVHFTTIKKGQIKINSQVKVNWSPESSLRKYCKQNCNSCSLWIILYCHILRKQSRIRDLICRWEQSGVKAEGTRTIRYKSAENSLGLDCALTTKHKLLRVPISYQQSWDAEHDQFSWNGFKITGGDKKDERIKNMDSYTYYQRYMTQ